MYYFSTFIFVYLFLAKVDSFPFLYLFLDARFERKISKKLQRTRVKQRFPITLIKKKNSTHTPEFRTEGLSESFN